jgi:hypothetical protein
MLIFAYCQHWKIAPEWRPHVLQTPFFTTSNLHILLLSVVGEKESTYICSQYLKAGNQIEHQDMHARYYENSP